MKRQNAMRRRSDVSSVRYDLPAPKRLGHGIMRCASMSNVPRAAASVPQVASTECRTREAGLLAVEEPDRGDRRQRDDVRDAVERAPLIGEPDAGAARDEVPAVARGRVRGARHGHDVGDVPLLSCLLGRCGRLVHRMLQGGRSRARGEAMSFGTTSYNSSAAPGLPKRPRRERCVKSSTCRPGAAVRAVVHRCGRSSPRNQAGYPQRGLRARGTSWYRRGPLDSPAAPGRTPMGCAPSSRVAMLHVRAAHLHACSRACARRRPLSIPARRDCRRGSHCPVPCTAAASIVCPFASGNRRSEPDRHSSRLLPAIHGGGAAGGH